MTREIVARQRKYKGKNYMPGARGSLLHGLLHLVHYLRRRHLHLFLLAVSILLHWRRRSPDIGGPQEVEHHAGLYLSSAKRPPTRHFCFPPLRRLLDPSPHFGLLVLPPVTVLEQVVPPTVVLRVAPPAVAIRSVVRALQVHTRKGMPGLELVEP